MTIMMWCRAVGKAVGKSEGGSEMLGKILCSESSCKILGRL